MPAVPQRKPVNRRGPMARRAGRFDETTDEPAEEEVAAAAKEEEPAAVEEPAAEAEAAPEVAESEKAEEEKKKEHKKGSAQHIVAEYWKTYKKGRKGQPSMVLPYNPYVVKTYGTTLPIKATASFEEAVAQCKAKVERIVTECRQQNERYRDHYFDLKADYLGEQSYVEEADKILRYTIDGLSYTSSLQPGGAKRVTAIFDDPVFYADGATAGDIKQGATGDCWFLAAVATITNVPSLLEKIVVARDEEVGVYGFVFYRDGEWISSIIDDQLFLALPEFTGIGASTVRGAIGYRVKEEVYTKTFLKGSDALYFGKCADKNETWLPLLEKAFAKAHNDYASIEGGWTGEAVEDLTGGVTTEVATIDILSKENFWQENMLHVNKGILLAAAISSQTGESVDGIYSGHAYSVLKAIEIEGIRLVLVRNPWGESEYNGPWSDGSKEWTSEWIAKINHTFGDDGAFWMTYNNFLRIFTELDRTRLFDDSWSVSTAWVSEAVEWENTYSKNRFQLTVTEKGKYVIVLQQLDNRYFKGLEGEYDFMLYFRVHKQGETDYFVRSKGNVTMSRSVSVEVELEPGTWDVAYKITAEKNEGRTAVQDVVQTVNMKNRKKFLQLGMSYDLAHAKGKPSKDKTVNENEKEAEVEKQETEEAENAEADEAESEEAGEADDKPAAKEKKSEKAETKKGKGVEPDADEAETVDTTEVKAADSEKKPKAKRYILVPEDEAAEVEEVEDECLWNAFAVVGLRVYSQNKGVTIEVIRPMKKKLIQDPDDPAKVEEENTKETTEEEAKKEGEASTAATDETKNEAGQEEKVKTEGEANTAATEETKNEAGQEEKVKTEGEADTAATEETKDETAQEAPATTEDSALANTLADAPAIASTDAPADTPAQPTAEIAAGEPAGATKTHAFLSNIKTSILSHVHKNPATETDSERAVEENDKAPENGS